ncbi:MAG: TetR/AcrR family transcriptional regulator [Candidatus Binatia bacterium]
MPRDAILAEAPLAPSSLVPSPDKREALLRAALELFAERTYGATPVPEIAARAHVGTGTVYRHFQSKEALANEVFRLCKTAMHDALRKALSGGGSEKERFLRLWQGLAELAGQDPVSLRFLELQHHEDYLDDESRRLSDAVFATAQDFVQEGQRSGAIRPASAGMVIALVFGAFVGMFKEYTAGRFELGDDAIVQAGEFAWRMISAD